MSSSTFNCHIVGRLGSDAKVNKIGENNAISFSVAISERKGEENVTSWINCTYWSKSDKIAQYLTKGKLVSVSADWYSEREHEGKRYSNFRVRDINPFLDFSILECRLLKSYNCQIVGRLGSDAKVNKIGENNAISFSVAISERKGEENVTSWINCTYWSKSDKIAQYLTKGKLVSVVSDFYNENEKDGKKYSNFRVKDITPFLEKSETKTEAPQGNFTEKPKEKEAENPFAEVYDDLQF